MYEDCCGGYVDEDRPVFSIRVRLAGFQSPAGVLVAQPHRPSGPAKNTPIRTEDTARGDNMMR